MVAIIVYTNQCAVIT